MRTTGVITSVYDLRALPIALPDGRNVRLDTIAEVRDQAGEQRSAALLDGKPVIGFQIVRSWGASALDVAKDAQAVVARLQEEYPQVKFAEAQAAYAVGYTELFSLITWTSVGLMGASATIAGQNLGARQELRAAP